MLTGVSSSYNINKFVNFFLSIFLLILTSNIIGRIPFQHTWTSSITFNLRITSQILISSYRYNFNKYSLNIANPVLLKNIEIRAVKYFRSILEVISIVARIFSLAIRLFANRLAGHILLHMLMQFQFGIIMSNINKGLTLFIISLFLPILAFILVLERSVAFLQSYVFTILSIIYRHETDIF